MSWQENRPYLWPSPAQSKLREPFGRSSRSLLWGAGWRIRQLRCHALCKNLWKAEDKEGYIHDTSELRSEHLYFRIEWICRTGIKVGLNGESRLICISTETAVYIDMTAWRPHKILWKHSFVLHLSDFLQVKNIHNLYLLDRQIIAFFERSSPAEKTAGGEHMVSISVHSCLRRNQ